MKKFFALVLAVLILWPGTEQAASRRPVSASHGMVASTSEIASQVGAQVMRNGGNAVDAAVAVALALAVVWPEAGNIGGGGFMLVRMKDGTAEAIDYRERAPLAASENMYLNAQGRLIADASTTGYRAVAVPGTVAGLALALKRFGTMRWAALVAPAEALARNGFRVSALLAERMPGSLDRLSPFPDSYRIFLRNGEFYREGEKLVQPELAATLARLRRFGAREFYQGETARRIVADMQAHGGLITMQDLKEYEPVVRKPVTGNYRGYEILAMPPPSSGGVALIEMLNMAELHDLRQLGFHSADHIHLVTEIMKRAFADRSVFLGDPDFVRVPVDTLASKGYAAGLNQRIDMQHATPSAKIQPETTALAVEHPNTTHFSIVDTEGNCVSNTFTLNDSFGSGVVAARTGIMLNDEMDDFTSAPGEPNMYGLIQGKANAIAPRKRPLSSMTPSIVLKDGKPLLIVGSPGGPTIISTVYQVISNVVDFGMDIQEAIDAPRLHHQWMPDLLFVEPFVLNKDTRLLLEEKGHRISDRPFFKGTKGYMGDAEGILIDPATQTRSGASDPRLAGVPVGY